MQHPQNDQQTHDEWLRLGATARLAQVARMTVHRAATAGELPYAVVGGWRVFRRIDVDQWAALRVGRHAQPRG
jgi:predicted DNA-binding transcriptional regulator AlpA